VKTINGLGMGMGHVQEINFHAAKATRHIAFERPCYRGEIACVLGPVGDKQSLYRAALRTFQCQLNGGMETLLQAGDLKTTLNQFFTMALDVYTSGETSLGCFIFCTAPAEAISHPDVRAEKVCRKSVEIHSDPQVENSWRAD
jgi:hypothetical protein